MENTTATGGLKRVIGVSGLAVTIVNFTIGAGIFVLPATIGLSLGTFSFVGYIFCGIMLAAIMFCYAEVGSRITSAGGSYAYVEAAFGKFPGFIVNCLFVFGWGILGDAALMNIIANSLAVISPVFINPVIRATLFFVLIGFMIWINIRGTKESIGFLKLITIVKLLPLFAIIIFGFSKINSANLQWGQTPGVSTFGNTALVLFYAFAGFETALGVSGEIKNPRRTIPLAILLGGTLVMIVYLLLQLVVQGTLGADLLRFKDAPLAAVADKLIGPIGGTILLCTTALSCFNGVTGDILSTPRLLFAGAKDGIFPKFLGKVHPKFATPHYAIVCFGVLIFIFSVSGSFKQLAVLASASVLLIYLAVVCATIKLRLSKKATGDTTLHMPGGLIIPIIAISSIVWLLSSLTRTEIESTLCFIAIICIFYWLMIRFQKNRPSTYNQFK